MYQTVTIEPRQTIALVTLNRPEARNSLNSVMRAEIKDALDRINRDPAIRAVIITGAGDRAFCAGMDLKEARQFDPDRAESWLAEFKGMYAAIRGLDKPCLAAINGVAAGAGFQIALLADIRIGHAGARMGQPEINAGLASVIGAHLMGLSLGHARTVELALTGRLVEGAECLALGLFNHLVAAGEVLAKAFAVAEELAAKPPVAMRLTKQRFREITQAGFDAVFEAGARLQREAYASGEPQQVMARFVAERGGKS